MKLRNAFFLVAALSACGGSSAPPPASASGPASGPSSVAAQPAPATPSAPAELTQRQRLGSDTTITTTAGATFTAPAGWAVITAPGLITLEGPESDLTMWIAEVPDVEKAEDAIQAAWKRAQPAFARPVERSVSPPPSEGWDAITVTTYQVPEADKRAVMAVAMRKSKLWYVTLLDGSLAAADRRGAQASLIVNSLKPMGAERESFRGKQAHALDDARLSSFAAFVEDARTKLKIPGAAIAIVQDGKVVFERGFGTRTKGKGAPVTARTLFMIGSTTKSLTTLLMAKLVDDKKFSWDTPVVELFPSFALGNDEATKKLTMKHTVCACTGLPRQDFEFLFEYTGVSPEERLSAMKLMVPTTGFGETFQYSNPMVAAGGYIAAHTAEPKRGLGQAFAAALTAHVLRPLKMTSTTLDVAAVGRSEHAVPHGLTLGLDYLPLPLSAEGAVSSVGPAGAAWSSARDMAQYMLLELSLGKTPDGKVLISEANMQKRREPQVKVSDDVHYGLGLILEEVGQIPVIGHGGNTLGFTSDLFFLPEHGIGMVVLTNGGGANAFRNVVKRRLFEILFDGKDEAAPNLAFALEQREKDVAQELAKITQEPEKDWIAGLAGTYENPDLGRIVLSVKGKRGLLDAGEWKSSFGRKTEADGTVQVVLLDPPLTGLTFRVAKDAAATTLVLEPPQKSYTFSPVKK